MEGVVFANFNMAPRSKYGAIWSILNPSAYGFGNARESLRRSSQNPAKLFRPQSPCSLIEPKRFYFIKKVLYCFGIRTEEIQLTALKNFQVPKALVVAAEKIPLNINLRLEVCICLTVD